MAIVRPMELRDIGPATELMEDLAARGKFLGSEFFADDYVERQNGFVETFLMSLNTPDMSLNLVGEHNGEIVMVFVAHLQGNYPYAKRKKTAYVPVLWFKDIPKIMAGRIIVKGLPILKEFLQSHGVDNFYGNTFHADDRARKLMRRINAKATYIRYECEV
jgi:hypothetical protein